MALHSKPEALAKLGSSHPCILKKQPILSPIEQRSLAGKMRTFMEAIIITLLIRSFFFPYEGNGRTEIT